VARIRTIKPEFFKHSKLFDAEQDAKLPLRLAYIGLWTCCDREGRFKWRPRELQLDILPFDKCDFSRVLDALASRGFIVRYEVNREVYGYIPSWKRNQFINNREASSTIPEPQQNDVFDASLTREPHVDDARGTDVVKERKGKEGNDASLTRVSVEEIYLAYPKHKAKNEALKAIARVLKNLNHGRDAAWLLERTKRYAELRKNQDAQYTPYPASWFNAGSYEDEELEETEKPLWIIEDTGEVYQPKGNL